MNAGTPDVFDVGTECIAAEAEGTAAARVRRSNGLAIVFANNCRTAHIQSGDCVQAENPVQAAVEWGGVDSVVSLLAPDPAADVIVSQSGLTLVGLGEDVNDLRSVTVQNGDGVVLDRVRLTAEFKLQHSIGVSQLGRCG